MGIASYRLPRKLPGVYCDVLPNIDTYIDLLNWLTTTMRWSHRLKMA